MQDDAVLCVYARNLWSGQEQSVHPSCISPVFILGVRLYSNINSKLSPEIKYSFTSLLFLLGPWGERQSVYVRLQQRRDSCTPKKKKTNPNQINEAINLYAFYLCTDANWKPIFKKIY